jgi:hypothetical protein
MVVYRFISGKGITFRMMLRSDWLARRFAMRNEYDQVETISGRVVYRKVLTRKRGRPKSRKPRVEA